MSRFVKVAFTRGNSKSADDEMSSVSQFFHIGGSVEQQRGCCELDDFGKYEITLYTSCCNADTGVYYYTTYDNNQITAVSMHHEDLDGVAPCIIPSSKKQNISARTKSKSKRPAALPNKKAKLTFGVFDFIRKSV